MPIIMNNTIIDKLVVKGDQDVDLSGSKIGTVVIEPDTYEEENRDDDTN